MARIVTWTILALALIAPQSDFQNPRTGRAQRNRAPTIHTFIPSVSVVNICPVHSVVACSGSGAIVTLVVQASDPDRDQLKYKYSVTAGVIAGTGEIASWDLAKVPPGFQTAKVDVTDQRGLKPSTTAQVEIVVCDTCHLFCPAITVSCPKNVAAGEGVTFVASVDGINPTDKITFLWNHSHGRRLGGQQGSKLRIEATGQPGDMITGTVRIRGIDPACNHQATCQTQITK